MRRGRLALGAWAVGVGLCAGVSGAEDAPAPHGDEAAQSGDPGRQLTYASVMFYEAKSLLGNDREQGLAMFRQIERLLNEALRLTEQGGGPGTNVLRSQSAFMLGQIYQNVFQNPGTAEQQYLAALAAFPGHFGAAQALGKLRMRAQPAPTPPTTP